MRKLSIVGADYRTEERVVGFYTTGERMKSWAGFGAFWGGIWGLFWGAGVFLVPAAGAMLVARPVVAALVGGLEGAVVGGANALVAALVGLGIPEQEALEYETELKAGKFLLMAHGTPPEVARARELLHQPVLA